MKEKLWAFCRKLISLALNLSILYMETIAMPISWDYGHELVFTMYTERTNMVRVAVGALVALCIEGKPCSSEELSRRLTELGVQGKTQITFLIGGSVGLDESLKQQSDWRLSMSPMTFPHHMARIMLLEQIYRAYQIAGGAKYHK